MTTPPTVHASAVLTGARAVLIRGPAGSGKSGLAMALIAGAQTGLLRFARLVADDRVLLEAHHGRLLARPPAALAGLIEVRGVGIAKLGRPQLAARVPLGLLVDLVAPEKVERLPEPAEETILGIRLRVLALAPFEASTVTKLHLALAQTAVP